jgi:hypothetical protein
MAVIIINVIYQMVKTTVAFLLLKRRTELVGNAKNPVSFFITTHENNGSIILRHFNEANEIGKAFLSLKN